MLELTDFDEKRINDRVMTAIDFKMSKKEAFVFFDNEFKFDKNLANGAKQTFEFVLTEKGD